MSDEERTWRAPGSVFARPCTNCGNNDIKTLPALDYEKADGTLVKQVWHCDKCGFEWKRGEGETA